MSAAAGTGLELAFALLNIFFFILFRSVAMHDLLVVCDGYCVNDRFTHKT